jgi:hypothetical protein
MLFNLRRGAEAPFRERSELTSQIQTITLLKPFGGVG